MNERRPMSIAQPGMTAWGRAAERELEAYGRSTALRAPDDLAERVMAGVIADAPTRAVRVPSSSAWAVLGRLRLAGGPMAVVLTLTIGAALAVAGAAALLERSNAQPPLDDVHQQPVVVVQATSTPDPVVQELTPAPPNVADPPAPNPQNHQAVEATDPSGADQKDAQPEATSDADEDRGSEGGEDRREDGGEDADETDEPDDSSSGGSPDESSGGSDGHDGEG